MKPASATTRLSRACGAVAGAELDALVVTDLVNVRYLTGFVASSAALVLRPDGAAMLTDFRYHGRARAEVPEVEHIRVARGIFDELARALPAGAERVGFEADDLTVADFEALAANPLRDVELVATQGVVERLRALKDAGEVDALAELARLADETLEGVLGRGLVGRSETAVAADFELELRHRGAEQSSFPMMCLAGAHGGSPHGRPCDEPIPRDVLVVMDFGVGLDGYFSDCTRTFATGEVDGQAREVYELVRRAQAAALEAVRPGAGLRDVDAVAREIIAAAGHGEDFGHGTGHGVGMRVQEEPRLSARSEGALEAGNVVTIEPGVYLPGRFGVRIEDLVVVTDDGYRCLSGLPKLLQVVA